LLAGTFLGEDSDFERRMGVRIDLRNGTLTLRENHGRSVVTEPEAQTGDSGVFWAIFFAAVPGIRIRADPGDFVRFFLGAGSERLPASFVIWMRGSRVLK
jgi:hypothetical protein